jgi:4-hydroxyphenylpyruvate dioxygenase-like putative hemolysin
MTRADRKEERVHPARRPDQRIQGVRIISIDHVQLAMPAGGEAVARRFYGDVLGFEEVPKPAALAGRGGVWFQSGVVQLHLGVEADFRPARKAHPALRVEGLPALIELVELHDAGGG